MAESNNARLKIAIVLAVNAALMVAIAHRASMLRDAWRVHEVVVQSQAELMKAGRAEENAP